MGFGAVQPTLAATGAFLASHLIHNVDAATQQAVVTESGASTVTSACPDKKITIPLRKIPQMPTALKHEGLCVCLTDPAVVDARLVAQIEMLPASSHPDRTRTIDRLENEAALEIEALQIKNLLNILQALGEKFGFAGYFNEEKLAQRKRGDPIWVGLGGFHGNSDSILGPRETVSPISSQMDSNEKRINSFVNVAHSLLSHLSLPSNYLPGNRKFWVLAEGVPNNKIVLPSLPGDQPSVAECLPRHPEVREEIANGRLSAFYAPAYDSRFSPDIGVLGSEPINQAGLITIGKQLRAEKHPGVLLESFRASGDFCANFREMLRQSLCNMTTERDQHIVRHTTELMQRFYGKKALKKGDVSSVIFVPRGKTHFFELAPIAPDTKPGCTLGPQMHLLFTASPSRIEYPEGSLERTYQTACLDKIAN